jgi:hypothetical protein
MSLHITLRLFNILRDITGKSSITLSLPYGAAEDDILLVLKTTHRELSNFIFSNSGELKPYIKLFRSASTQPSEKNISDGESFDLFVVTSGG